MRLDHIAYRVADRYKTARFFIECFGYRFAEGLPEGFEIEFEDHSRAKCLVMVPPEKIEIPVPWTVFEPIAGNANKEFQEYHIPPEIFISDGTEGSVVKEWVNARNRVGGIHHLAYQVDSVEDTMEEWRAKGYAEFTTEQPFKCDGLTQVFTQPSHLTGIIYEFIYREKQGFCQENVKDLMNSTKKFSS